MEKKGQEVNPYSREVVSLAHCFQLGRALRHHDVDLFLSIYDNCLYCLTDGEDQLSSMKELARQISELHSQHFQLLETAYHDKHLDSILMSDSVDLNSLCCEMCHITSDSGVCSDENEKIPTNIKDTTRETISTQTNKSLIDNASQNSHPHLRSTDLVPKQLHTPGLHVYCNGTVVKVTSNCDEKVTNEEIRDKRRLQKRRGRDKNVMFDYKEAVEFLWKGWCKVKEEQSKFRYRNL